MVTKTEETTTDVWSMEPKAPGESREFLTVTLKAGTGYDAPWLVFHASSVAEALGALQDSDLDELMDLTARKGKELAKAFGGSTGFSKPAGGGGWGNKGPAKPAPKKAAPKPSSGDLEYDEDTDTYRCQHGEMNWISKKNGNRTWYAWGCPADQDDPSKCGLHFANKDGSLQD